MAVRVLIEREIEPGDESKLQQLLMEMRMKAIRAGGYISGETLRNLNNPNMFLVVSTWNSMEDWKAWEKSADRGQSVEILGRYLRVPEKISIYTNL